MRARRLSPRLAVAVLLLSATFLGACGGGAVDPRPSVPMPLRWVDGAARALRVIAKVPVPPTPDAWIVQAPAAAVVEVGNGPSLQLGEARDLRVFVPGPADVTRTNLVRVRLAARDPVRVRLGLGRIDADGTPTAHWSDDFAVLNRGEVTTAEFEVSPLSSDTHLLLHAHSKFRAQIEVRGFELLDSPPERRIAAVDEPARWIELAGEARLAHAVGVRRDVGATVVVPKGGVLHLPWASGPVAREDGVLRVLVEDDGQETAVAQLELRGRDAAWVDERIDLSAFSGREVEVRFAVSGPRLALLGEPSVGADLEAPPTVLLISSDTHRADHVATAPGAAPLQTPALDALAARGVAFERAFSSSNITIPSHVTLMTGTNPKDTGVIDNLTRLHDRASTLAEAFHAAGWETVAAVSATHLSPHVCGLGQGFRRMSWPTELERPAQQTIEVLRTWLDDAHGRPLFAWLHLFDAHRPYEADPALVRDAYGLARDPFGPPTEDFPEIGEAKGVRDPEWVRAIYRAQIEELDRALGELLRHPRLANAVIAFTADHGESLGDQGLWWDHMGAYPSVLHVPLVLAWPDAPGGTRVEATVGQSDVGRTLLDLAGLGTRPFPGTDLLTWLAPDAPQDPRFAVSDNAHSVAVTQGSWHLTITLHNGANKRQITRDNAQHHPVELFDLDNDPLCEHDLSWTEPTVTARMGQALLDWIAREHGDLSDGEEASEETRAQIAALGYASGAGDIGGRLDPTSIRDRLAPYFAAVSREPDAADPAGER